MSEHEIGRAVEFKVDRLDKQYLRGEITEREYDRAVKAIEQWADIQYRQIDEASYYEGSNDMHSDYYHC